MNKKDSPFKITGNFNSINISVDDFKRIRQENSLYVDKTKMIEDILTHDKSNVVLFTRPRRFGKSLNLSMLRYFFDMTEDSRELFKELYIENSSFFKTHLNKYPVLYLNFKDTDTRMFQNVEDGIIFSIQESLHELNKKYNFEELKNIPLKTSSGSLSPLGVKSITRVLNEKTGKKVIVLVDEYDSVINQTYGTADWKQSAEIVKRLFGALFKSNEYLEMGVLTGVSRIGKELGFSDMNNLFVCSLTKRRYYEYFGFTENEVKEILMLSGIEITAEFYRMYNGYRFDESPNMFNPASILKFLSDFQDTGKIKLSPYWINSSANKILKDNIAKQSFTFKEKLLTLLDGGTITESIFESIDYDLLHKSSYLFSLLIDTGYLCPVTHVDGDLFELKIPNREVLYGYRDMIESITGTDGEKLEILCTNLIEGKTDKFEKNLNAILLGVSSFHDFSEKENSYHNLLMGALLFLLGRFNIYSNRESGLGRFDIALIPNEKFRNKYRPVIIEFKTAKDNAESTYDELKELAQYALRQIISKKYAAGYEQMYAEEDFLLVGIGAQGKNCAAVILNSNQPNSIFPDI
jgi:hypothetical protein